MQTFTLPARLCLTAWGDPADPTFDEALAEARRLLERLERTVRHVDTSSASPAGFCLRIAADEPASSTGPSADLLADVRHDGYRIVVAPEEVLLGAATAKGLLNAVYGLAQRLGYRFLLPSEQWEWPPPEPRALQTGPYLCNPRFAHRGVFASALNLGDFTPEQWLRFYAKLRFNALAFHGSDPACVRLARRLGFRLETGGHGLPDLLPRALFDQRPELFRMAQPEDFAGQRTPDANLCPTHPDAAAIIATNYRKRLDACAGYHAVHAWPDDLPGGGWCLCPRCRALTPSDQALLAMRHLARAAARSGRNMRVPVIAYHDTIPPPRTIRPAPECLLLYAPRERCYAHALDDPTCARNAWYLRALQGWMHCFADIDDAHTFEYYFDQVLFRGHHPFIPEVIFRDASVYERAGIQSHMSLQVNGPAIAPEFNLLVFSAANWDADLTADGFIDDLASAFGPAGPTWGRYLRRRAAIHATALRMCEHPVEIYLDYRWLPESTSDFGREMAGAYDAAARDTADAAASLEYDAAAGDERMALLVDREASRARFEAADFTAMAAQQRAANALASYHACGERRAREEAVSQLGDTIRHLDAAREAALAAGLPDDRLYVRTVNRWLAREMGEEVNLFSRTAHDD